MTLTTTDLWGRWKHISGKLSLNKDIFISLQIEKLGTVDIDLREREKKCIDYRNSCKKNNGVEFKIGTPEFDHHNLTQIYSYLWILGLYEVLRTLRQSLDKLKPGLKITLFQKPDGYFVNVYETVEKIRMALAKHEEKTKEKEKYFQFPMEIDDNGVSSHAMNPSKEKDKLFRGVEIIARVKIADMFLEAGSKL